MISKILKDRFKFLILDYYAIFYGLIPTHKLVDGEKTKEELAILLEKML